MYDTVLIKQRLTVEKVLNMDGAATILHIAILHLASLCPRVPVRVVQNRWIPVLTAIVDLVITTQSVLLDNAVSHRDECTRRHSNTSRFFSWLV